MATSKKSSILGAILNGPPVPEEKTRPGVFIIESLGFRDERKKRFEGQILRDMLTLTCIMHERISDEVLRSTGGSLPG
jgi:hypothetical protein